MTIHQVYQALDDLTDYLLWARSRQQQGFLVDANRFQDAQYIVYRLYRLIIETDR